MAPMLKQRQKRYPERASRHIGAQPSLHHGHRPTRTRLSSRLIFDPEKISFISMDFLTLATETSPRRVARFLEQALGDDGASSASLPGSTEQRPLLSKTAEAELYL